jgi:glycosyltransferase involved in cell wall biosynthesis
LPRKIAIDYRMSQSSGIGVYLRNIVPRLAVQYRSEFQFSLLGGDEVPGVASHIGLKSRIYSLGELVEVPAHVPRSSDVLWCPNYNAPLISPGKLVVTVHDVCHLALPQLFRSRLKQAYAKMMFANVRRRASRVICDSRFTASEVGRLAGIDLAKTTVIYPGIDGAWRVPSKSARPVASPYVLYVGNVKPHKNLGRLLQAFALLKERIPHSLTIVGRREGFITPDREVMLAAEKLGPRVVFTGEVSDELLRSYYAHADLLVFPSLYEGFGFPPLEAMAMGIPVAASNAGSIPEVCGDAAAYFDPYSVDEMTTVIENALSDRALRTMLVERGMRQVDRYSWDTTVGQVASVFREVISRPP